MFEDRPSVLRVSYPHGAPDGAQTRTVPTLYALVDASDEPITRALVGVLGTYDETYANAFDLANDPLFEVDDDGTLRIKGEGVSLTRRSTTDVSVTYTVDGVAQSSRTESVRIVPYLVNAVWVDGETGDIVPNEHLSEVNNDGAILEQV